MPRYHEGQRITYNGVPGTITYVGRCDCQMCVDNHGPDGLLQYEIELDDYDENEMDFYTLEEDEIVLFDPPKRQKGFAKFIQAKNL